MVTTISIVVMLLQLVLLLLLMMCGNDNVAACVASATNVATVDDDGVPYFDVDVVDIPVAFAITLPLAIVSIVDAFVVSASARWTAESIARYIIGYLRTVRNNLRVLYRLYT